jgi:hypothetical protein
MIDPHGWLKRITQSNQDLKDRMKDVNAANRAWCGRPNPMPTKPPDGFAMRGSA